jgi:hypothetical protein
MEWLADNPIEGVNRPGLVVRQLRQKYTPEVIKGLMDALREANFGMQITRVTARMLQQDGLNVEKCDKLLTKLQDAVVTVNAKKAELQG